MVYTALTVQMPYGQQIKCMKSIIMQEYILTMYSTPDRKQLMKNRSLSESLSDIDSKRVKKGSGSYVEYLLWKYERSCI